MNRKIGALVLMVLLLIGCQSSCKKQDVSDIEPETTTEKMVMVKDVLDYMEQQKWNSTSFQFDYEISKEAYIHAMILWKKISNEKGIIDIAADFAYSNIKSEKMSHVTTIYYQNNDFYINQKEICDYIISLDEQFISITGFFKKLEDYILVTPQDIAKILDQNGMRQEEILLLRFFNQTVEERFLSMKEMIWQLKNLAIKFGENRSLLDLSEKEVKLNFNAKNFATIYEQMKSCEVENSYDDILQSKRNDIENAFVKNLEAAKDFSGKFCFGVLDKNVPYVMGEYAISDSTEYGKFKLELTQVELQNFQKPERYVDFSEFMKIYERVQKFLGFLS